MPPHSTLVGHRFGKLTVIELDTSPTPAKGFHWLCLCDCGRGLSVRSDALTSGNTKSCGCLHKQAGITHGKTGTPTFIVWMGMKARCENPREPAYKDYGGRGVSVCERWRSSFESFLEDMGERPAGLSLDRVDNNGNYEPGNCRWATKIQQARNTRSNRFITYAGETLTLAGWAEKIGVSTGTLWARLNVYNWSLDRAIETGNTMYTRYNRN